MYEPPLLHLLEPVTDPVSQQHPDAGLSGTAPGFHVTTTVSGFAAHSSADRRPGSGEEAHAARTADRCFAARKNREPSATWMTPPATRWFPMTWMPNWLYCCTPPSSLPPRHRPRRDRRGTADKLTTAVVVTVSVFSAAACYRPLRQAASGADPPGVASLWPLLIYAPYCGDPVSRCCVAPRPPPAYRSRLVRARLLCGRNHHSLCAVCSRHTDRYRRHRPAPITVVLCFQQFVRQLDQAAPGSFHACPARRRGPWPPPAVRPVSRKETRYRPSASASGQPRPGWPRPCSSRSGDRGLARMLHGAGCREPSARPAIHAGRPTGTERQ